MLILTRRLAETVEFPDQGITICIQACRGKSVRLSIEAPREIRIVRGELLARDGELTNGASDPATVQKENRFRASTPSAQLPLETARLAIHLAQNQIQHHRPGHAERALDNALQALEELELKLARQSQWSDHPQPAVRETASSYSLNSSWRASDLLDLADHATLMDGNLGTSRPVVMMS